MNEGCFVDKSLNKQGQCWRFKKIQQWVYVQWKSTLYSELLFTWRDGPKLSNEVPFPRSSICIFLKLYNVDTVFLKNTPLSFLFP